MSGFQSVVNTFPNPAVAGDFASENPRQSMVTGDSELTAAAAGPLVGHFAWADANGYVYAAKPGAGVARLGFCARHGNNLALIQTWMAEASLLIVEGMPVTLHTVCDMWVMTTVAAAVAGNKAFASTTDGSIQPGAAGATIAGYEETSWYFVHPAAVGVVAMLTQNYGS